MKRFLPKFIIVVFTGLSLSAQNSGSNPSPSPTVAGADPERIVAFLSKTVSWYREHAVEQQLATQPSDLAFFQENRHVADQVVQQAFDYARQQADARAKQRGTQTSAPSADLQHYEELTEAAQKTQQELQDTQSELEQTRGKLGHAHPAQKGLLQSQVGELESEVGMLQARSEALQSMIEFVSASNAGTSGAGLRAQIEELARTVPSSLSRPQATGQREAVQPEPSNSANVSPARLEPEPTGIWGLAATAVHLYGKMHSLDGEIQSTSDLGRDAGSLRQPLVDDLRNLIREGDTLFAAADTATPAQLAQQTQQIEALTGRFKQASDAMLPLGKIGILLDTYQRSLTNWRESVKDNLRQELRELLFRLLVLAALIAMVIGFGELWRRTTFRYVRDARRRYQFLLLRRIVIWVTIGIIVVLTFASQLGSAVTFAGLITAGVAVALQNVILSIVAYFFLIGKYGIRVGDRVQIAGVTGEVVELGLVRIHLMEMEGPNNSQPTGRTVAFSNSIVFQPASGVFKQVPGTNFVWHEIKLTLAPDTDYAAARERITQAVESALTEYGQTMNAQREVMARHLSSVAPAEFRPKIRLRYAGTGVEATVTFPADFQKSSEMHDRVMKEIMAALGREPRIKLLGAEAPSARASD